MRGKDAIQLSLYGLSHAIVDTISIGVLFSIWQGGVIETAEAGWLLLLYNLLAFGVQPILGLIVDWSQRPRAAAFVGCLLVAAATAGNEGWPRVAVCLAGVGNGVFHLGAGSICLNLTPGRATAPGFFVAPGAVGVFAGTYLGLAGSFMAWPFVLALTLICACLVMIPPPRIPPPVKEPEAVSFPVSIPVVLILACIGIRSLVGSGVELPWKDEFSLAFGLVVLVVIGKALGGVLADWLGWGRVAIGALAVATPLLAFGAANAGAGLTGTFLVNLSMPVTLAAIANLLPGRPAFAFGLTCLALEIGTLPVTLPVEEADVFGRPWIVFATMSVAAIALYIGLRLAFQRWPARFADVHE
ncbi:MAG: hypothetical protein NTY19_25095 [Planctomycetota bacterium]|nr:hypothetical protein [Planctomycetota bacterium]